MTILANDGLSSEGVAALAAAGFSVSTETVPQEQLADTINREKYSVLLVRSATKVRRALIDACPHLKLIGRGGVGMDNIDVEYARSKNIHVINTPAASSLSVAELVMGNLFSLSRFTHHAHREMPASGNTHFKALKKKYSKGQELRGKTIGIVGLGKIGQALAGYALGAGMKVEAVDPYIGTVKVPVHIAGHTGVDVTIRPSTSLDELLPQLDYLSIHVPQQEGGAAVIGTAQFEKMKEGVIVVNASRGGTIDEEALTRAIEKGKVRAAALDVFEGEPHPSTAILGHPAIASTPHIGAATVEAQRRIGLELADQIIQLLQ